MNYFNTAYNSIFKSPPKINNLDIILESNGEYSTPPSNNYTPINDKLQTSFLKPVSNISSSNPTKQSTTSTTSLKSRNCSSPQTSIGFPSIRFLILIPSIVKKFLCLFENYLIFFSK